MVAMFSLEVGRQVLDFLYEEGVISLPDEVRDIDDEELQQMQYVFGGVEYETWSCARFLRWVARKGSLSDFKKIYTMVQDRYYPRDTPWDGIWDDIWLNLMLDVCGIGALGIIKFVLDEVLDQNSEDLPRLIKLVCANGWERSLVQIFLADSTYEFAHIGDSLCHLVQHNMLKAMKVVVDHPKSPLRLNKLSQHQHSRQDHRTTKKKLIPLIVELTKSLVVLSRELGHADMLEVLRDAPYFRASTAQEDHHEQ